MTESIRPSASEEARAAARSADQKKTKQTQNLSGQQGALNSNQSGQSKKLANNAFEEMLKNASDQGTAANLLPPENKFDSRLKEATRDDNRESSSDRDKTEDDKKTTDKPDSGKKSKETGLSARERVLGKHSSGEQGSGGGGSGEKREGGGSGQRGFQKDSQNAQTFATDLRRREPAPAPVPIELQNIQQTGGITPPEVAEAPRELPKALLDQIVQSVTIVQKKDMSKEIQIDFRDNMFNGLRLKVTAQGSEVSVEFLVPNRSVEETFRQERENIALALGEKGVDVRSIKVTRT